MKVLLMQTARPAIAMVLLRHDGLTVGVVGGTDAIRSWIFVAHTYYVQL
jgi:hypothetical protein